MIFASASRLSIENCRLRNLSRYLRRAGAETVFVRLTLPEIPPLLGTNVGITTTRQVTSGNLKHY